LKGYGGFRSKEAMVVAVREWLECKSALPTATEFLKLLSTWDKRVYALGK
jgi:hypothetical protein